MEIFRNGTKTLCILLALAIFTGSCDRPTNLPESISRETSFSELLSVRDMNESVHMGRYPVFENGDSEEKLPNASESFNVYLANHSSDVYYFPGSENPNIYHYDEKAGQWIRVGVMDRNGNDVTLPAESESPEFGVTPCFLQTAQPIEVRVAMIGYKVENQQPTHSRIGAYLDVTIQPRETCDRGYCIGLAIDHAPTDPDRIHVTTTLLTPSVRNDFEVFIGTNDTTAVIEDIDTPDAEWNGFKGRIWKVDTLPNTPLSYLATITFPAMGQKTIYASVYPSYGESIYASDFMIYDYDETGGKVITSCEDIQFP